MSKKKAEKKQKEEQIEEVVVEEQKAPELTAEEQIAELKDKQLRLFAEFENFKKRTAKERIELYKTAGENILTSLLPILDDFERSIKARNYCKYCKLRAYYLFMKTNNISSYTNLTLVKSNTWLVNTVYVSESCSSIFRSHYVKGSI